MLLEGLTSPNTGGEYMHLWVTLVDIDYIQSFKHESISMMRVGSHASTLPFNTSFLKVWVCRCCKQWSRNILLYRYSLYPCVCTETYWYGIVISNIYMGMHLETYACTIVLFVKHRNLIPSSCFLKINKSVVTKYMSCFSTYFSM